MDALRSRPSPVPDGIRPAMRWKWKQLPQEVQEIVAMCVPNVQLMEWQLIRRFGRQLGSNYALTALDCLVPVVGSCALPTESVRPALIAARHRTLDEAMRVFSGQ